MLNVRKLSPTTSTTTFPAQMMRRRKCEAGRALINDVRALRTQYDHTLDLMRRTAGAEQGRTCVGADRACCGVAFAIVGNARFDLLGESDS